MTPPATASTAPAPPPAAADAAIDPPTARILLAEDVSKPFTATRLWEVIDRLLAEARAA